MADNWDMFFVYFLKSLKTNQTYVGFTEKSPLVRLKEHNNGSNEWTSKRKPFILVYFEKYSCELDARQREKFYKTGFGKAIKSLILRYLEEKGIRP